MLGEYQVSLGVQVVSPSACTVTVHDDSSLNDVPLIEMNGSVSTQSCNNTYSYTVPTRAVWDLLPEPSGSGNKSHAVRGGVV